MRVFVTSDLERMLGGLKRQESRVLRAIAEGLNEGGDKVRTQVRRAMREQTGLLRLKSVTSREGNIRATIPAGAAPAGVHLAFGLAYTIIYRGKPATKPDEFKKSVKRGPGGGVTVWLWGVAHKFKRSFQQKFKGGLRMRLGGPREPIRGFDGPNLAKEAVKGQVAATFQAQAATLVRPAIEKRLARAL